MMEPVKFFMGKININWVGENFLGWPGVGLCFALAG